MDALSSIMNAISIGETMLKSKSAYDQAQLKLEVDKLVDSLLEAKREIRKMDDLLDEQNREIKKLKNELEVKASAPKVGRFEDGIYKLDESGWPTGNPYCMTCFAKDERLSPITQASLIPDVTMCSVCNSSFQTLKTPQKIHTRFNQKKKDPNFKPDVEILN
ncbi:hypothetical protein OA7_0008800 [Vibrio cyclitrophicus 1F53]|uniref:hypothetical protein n=1 Tax=Vibrio cyclitrophicus TaxID=47951 RepID=UPI0003778CA9|nr:hypothetical protein [Vibrio cyclitrophicus]OEF34403.1 hypothetical protein OA7_08540 [Vibrio cyclitrophicus 1F53]OEF67074.1 hypothetical protein OAA_06540 [Vibrio cyclitrophicus 1F175]PMH33285.1 hypothetical protein BCU72_01620 [Vibrio cyclitrophicus]PMH79179.1 hypothetical protein BCU60_19845 [Vibrio cyclitrophicus]